MRSWSAVLVHVTMGVALGAGAATMCAASDDPAIAQGQKLYDEYCASCHGADGKGAAKADAEAAPISPRSPSRTAASFPSTTSCCQISGRKPTGQDQDTSLPGSCPRRTAGGKMPSWGQIFAKQEGSEGTALDLQLQTTGKIMLITEYLQSIQAK